jgi:hypothetical protein
VDSPQPTIRDLLNELVARVAKVEENQAALEGAIQAFITVFAVRRLPDRLGTEREADTAEVPPRREDR